MSVSDELAARVASVCDVLFNELSHARAVLVATEDGMAVHSRTSMAMDAERFAAITSSMSAIGDVVSHESALGQVRCVMVEADEGYLVMRGCRMGSVGLVVAALVGREALLGLAIHRVGQAARELSE